MKIKWEGKQKFETVKKVSTGEEIGSRCQLYRTNKKLKVTNKRERGNRKIRLLVGERAMRRPKTKV